MKALLFGFFIPFLLAGNLFSQTQTKQDPFHGHLFQLRSSFCLNKIFLIIMTFIKNKENYENPILLFCCINFILGKFI